MSQTASMRYSASKRFTASASVSTSGKQIRLNPRFVEPTKSKAAR